MSAWFTDHTVESAPPAARRAMSGVRDERGYIPAAVARMAASPLLLDAFLRLSKTFEGSTLDPLAREVVVMTIAARNACHVCVAMHSARLTALGAEPDLIGALRAATPLGDPRLEAVRVFTLRVLDTAGAVGDDAFREFLGHGFTTQHALEVVLGIGIYTMSTLANRLTDAPVDDQLSAFA
jgi:AhpD family alkylhydroperoxidase